MKNLKKVFLAVLAFALGFAMFSCVPKEDPKPTPDPDPVKPDPEEPVEIENFVIVLEDGAQTRAYNENFDEMVTDFSSASEANVANHLRVAVGDKLENPANNADAAIYKMATGTYPIETYDGIGFRMRKVGEGQLTLANLVLALRGDDAFDVYELHLDEVVDQDGDALPELTEEYQDIVISPNLSIEDDATVYQLAGGAGASEVKVLDKILGFHLYLTGECAQVIEIEEVFLIKGGEKTTLDSFNREKVNKADDTCWWRDSRGFIVQQGVDASKKAIEFEVAHSGKYLVLNVMGDSSSATINGVAWADLVDGNGNHVASAVNGAFFPLVIDLEASGITGNAITIASEKELVVSKVYYSSLEDREAVTEYPIIDTKNIVMFDNFNREQSGFDGDYDKSVANPLIIAAGLNYALSYHNGDLVTINGGQVVFDATTLGAADYINFKEGNDCYNGEKYLVLVVKLEDGATLDGFRINVGNDFVYANQMRSAFGLPVPLVHDEAYPYTDADGYMWLIIDLEESGMAFKNDDQSIDYYYSGTGKMYIDAAFLANLPGVEYEETIVNVINSEVNDSYMYCQGFSTDGAKYAKLVFESESDATLETFRIEGEKGAVWFNAKAIIGMDGEPIEATQKLAGLTIVIDLEASGLSMGWNHLHAGGAGAATGAFTLTVYKLTEKEAAVEYNETIINVINSEVNDSYMYCQGFSTDGAQYAKLVFESESDATLDTLRIEGENGAIWFNSGAIKGMDGQPIDANQKLAGLEIVIDLKASGLSMGWNHLHAGGAGAATGTFTLTVYKLTEKPAYDEIVSNVVNGEVNDSYMYCQGFSAEGDQYVILRFASESDATLETLRLEGDNGAKWFAANEIIGMDGEPIAATQKLAGLEIVIDMKASGLSMGWNHLHAGGAGAVTGTFTMTAVRMHFASQYGKVMEALTK